MLPILGVIGSLISGAGSIFGGIFNFKSQQAQVVSDTIKVLGDVTTTDAQRDIAIQQALSVQPGSNFANNVRPMIALLFAMLILCKWFGITPPHMSADDSEWVYLIVGTYMGITAGGRTLEKIIQMISSAGVLKALIGAKNANQK